MEEWDGGRIVGVGFPRRFTVAITPFLPPFFCRKSRGKGGGGKFTRVNTFSSANKYVYVYTLCVVFATQRVVSVNIRVFIKENVMSQDQFNLSSCKISVCVVLQIFLQLCIYFRANKIYRLPWNKK